MTQFIIRNCSILSSGIQDAILASFPKILSETTFVVCNKPVVIWLFDWWGRSKLFMAAEAINVIWPAVSTHHQGLVRIVLLYWFWRAAQSCLCPCLHGRQPGSVSFRKRGEQGGSSLMAREVKADGLSAWIFRLAGNLFSWGVNEMYFLKFSLIFAVIVSPSMHQCT